MSDDLVSRLRDERHCNDWYLRQSAATALEEARAEIERLRFFEKAKAQEETCDTFGEIGFVGIRDYAAMQARAEKAESELSTLRAMLTAASQE